MKLAIDVLTFENDGESIFKVNNYAPTLKNCEKVNFGEITNEFGKIHFKCYKND